MRTSEKDDLGSIALKAVADLTASAALLDSRQRVVYFHGKTDAYLTHPHGRANLDVYSMARAGLEAPIRSAVTQARRHDEPATAEATVMRSSGPVLAGRPDLPQEVTDRLATITRNIEIEIRLIDDLLDLTRVGRGQLHFRRERIDALDLMNETVGLCRSDSAKKRQKVVVEGSSGECTVDVDRIRLQQVIWNLLRNAIRFTPEGGTITASCECMGDQVLLVVSDTGSGIPKEQLPRIFVSFERNDETSSGLGLGLSIAKSLIEAHGGRIEAESEGAGKGARFRVWLPRASSHPESQPPDTAGHPDREKGVHSPGTADLAGLRILLIEDHVDSANTMAALLQAQCCATEIAGTLEEAVSAVEQHKFDLIVSDLALPDGTGYELIRKLPHRVPAVALSGLGSPQDRQRSVRAGFVEHLVKPVTISALSSAILRAVNSA
ncbi:MAG TPA: hybrid sensor histidine kinase/response regulator [Woeseiaceae bacterium]|nr:hybrid sensor histidine kinase/response regulator [Woeseiaceae bacterium]